MAQLACNYHEQLQQSPPDDLLNQEDYVTQIKDILNAIPADQKLDDPHQTMMNWHITQDQVEKALHLTKNGSATSLDVSPPLCKKHDALDSVRNNAFVWKMLWQ